LSVSVIQTRLAHSMRNGPWSNLMEAGWSFSAERASTRPLGAVHRHGTK
jgi:hypothetical protein